MKHKEEEIVYLETSSLQANPLQPRGMIPPESIMDLVDSIKEHGILEPLVVAQTPAGYQIVAGERRWRAGKIAGLIKVPCIVKQTSPRGMLEMALVENVQRIDLNALERAKAFERLLREFALTKTEIGQRIAKSQSYVSNTLRLLELPDALKDGLISGLITEGHARALSAIQNSNLMIEAYKMILKESGSVRRAEELARRMKKKSNQPPHEKTVVGESHIIDEKIDTMRNELNTALGDDAKVKLIRTQRQTRIHLILQGNPETTEENLQRIYKGITSPRS
ncbi:ParB/RepB/Spo0J family partition protein [Patescibacteria group bacterium]|nr:ParB/RepB/Spo0J family partition protein [Patescibacteria group bacterium]MBU1931737.1 ParB/RepB/Spo0J family partition protein [Patescibacteria group bacterium]